MRKDSTSLKVGTTFGCLVAQLTGVGWLGLSRMRRSDASGILVLLAVGLAGSIAVFVTVWLSREMEDRDWDRRAVQRRIADLEEKVALRTEESALLAGALHEQVRAGEAQEADLRRSEARLRSFIENAPCGILQLTPEGRIARANPALVEMLGYASEGDVLELRIRTDVYRNAEQWEAANAWSRKQESIRGMEADWTHKTGKVLTTRSTAHLVKDGDGRVEFVESFVEDISERRAMMGQLQRMREIEAIGRVAGGIAQDFNQMLGMIMEYGDLMPDPSGPRNSSPPATPAPSGGKN